MSFLQPLPENPEERQAFNDIYMREVRQYRRRPSFIVGMILAGISAFGLIYLTSGGIPRLVILCGIFGVSFVHDTLTRHFCTVLLKHERIARHPPAPKGGQCANT